MAISVFAAEDLYYGITPTYPIAIFTLLGSQLFGYGKHLEFADFVNCFPDSLSSQVSLD